MSRPFPITLPVVLVLAGVFLYASGCGCSRDKVPGGSPAEEGAAAAVPVREAATEAETSGDLEALREKGEVRILTWRSGDRYLPRAGSPLDLHEQYAAKFVRGLGLQPVFVYVRDFDDLIPSLTEGRGDFIAANMTVTEPRKELVAFSVPVTHTREQIVARAGEGKLKDVKDLKGRTVAVQPGTSFLDTLEKLSGQYPDIAIQMIPGELSSDEVFDKVAGRDIDLTIEDANVIRAALGYRHDVEPVLDVTGDRPLAWAVRKENPALLKELDAFITREKLAYRPQAVYREDLAGLKKRKVLRVLTRNNAANYFLWRGELMGFEYEMVKHFAERQGLRVEMVVAPSQAELIPMLLEGKGDLIAAFMTINDERRAMGVEFSTPYNVVSEVVVARADEKGLDGLDDLAGRTLVVRRGSSYWQTLTQLRAEGAAFKLAEAPATMETEEIIGKVAEGEYDLTLADSHLVDIELAWRDGIQAAFPVKEKVQHGWAVRAQDKKLLAAVNDFWGKEYRGLLANMTYNKYFKTPKKMRGFREERIDTGEGGRLSPYDDLVRHFSGAYGFDWRLMVAQMYQESHFDPKAKSWVGAMGLMQVMPKTAKEMGFTDLEKPPIGIHAGIKYMDWTRARFSPELDVADRTWFALAAYNAGIGHVKDARRLAREKGWNGDRWFGNVEEAMLLLARPEYANKARYGYVRGEEPVNYVRQIRDRYQAYVPLTAPAAGRAL